jgi:hypothetical protein
MNDGVDMISLQYEMNADEFSEIVVLGKTSVSDNTANPIRIQENKYLKNLFNLFLLNAGEIIYAISDTQKKNDDEFQPPLKDKISFKIVANPYFRTQMTKYEAINKDETDLQNKNTTTKPIETDTFKQNKKIIEHLQFFGPYQIKANDIIVMYLKDTTINKANLTADGGVETNGGSVSASKTRYRRRRPKQRLSNNRKSKRK